MALDGFVLGPAGPVFTAALAAGTEVFVIVGGVAKVATVSEVSDIHEGETVRLLTVLGDFVVPSDELVITRGGPVRASIVAEDVRRGREPRLEIVNPTALPTKGSKPSKGRAVQSLLHSLHPSVVQVPAPVADEIGDDLERILTDAGVGFTKTEDDRWTAFVIEDTPTKPRMDGARGVAETLMMLTAWGWERDSLLSRTRLDATEARRQLLVALVRDAEPFEARWTPGYRPVECRIHRPQEGRWPPFVAVGGALAEAGGFVHVTTSERGGLVVGLVVSGPVA